MSKATETDVPIIDSHIHLYPASEINTLAWCSPGNPIYTQHSVDEYLAATNSNKFLKGFIFVETDRIHDLDKGIEDGSGWQYPLMEVDWLRRIAAGTPKLGEGHEALHKELCLAIVPWAPLPSGAQALERYVEMVRERAGESWEKIRGFRYLVQDKKEGTMLGTGFIEGLKWLGTKGFTFDVGIDHHRGGDWQLDEAVQMIRRAHEGVAEEEKVTFILDHLCKPDMTLFMLGSVEDDGRFRYWREVIFKLSKFSKTYIKLSGCFSEIPKEYFKEDAEEIFEMLQPWLIVVLTAFGPSRIMFGSDWPVCTIGVANDAWERWRWIVQRMCQLANFSMRDDIMLWSGTAIKAYGIKVKGSP